MPTNQLYHTWIQRIRELRPEQRITQVRNFVLLMSGIYQSRSVYLSRIAGKVPGNAKLPSTVKRFERFLGNPVIRVRDWYKPVAQQWLAEQFAHLGEIHLIVDGTKVGFRHQLLMVSLGPIASEPSRSPGLGSGMFAAIVQGANRSHYLPM